MEMKRNLTFHAYALGGLVLSWLVLVIALQGDGRTGFAALGDAIILVIVTGCLLAHAIVSSIIVFLVREVRHGVFFAHGVAGAVDITLLMMAFAFG